MTPADKCKRYMARSTQPEPRANEATYFEWVIALSNAYVNSCSLIVDRVHSYNIFRCQKMQPPPKKKKKKMNLHPLVIERNLLNAGSIHVLLIDVMALKNPLAHGSHLGWAVAEPATDV